MAFNARSRLMRCSQFRKNRIAAPTNTTELMLESSACTELVKSSKLNCRTCATRNASQDDDPQAQHHRDATQQQVRLLYPARPPHRFFGHLQ